MKILKALFRALFGKNTQDFRVVVICIMGATTFWFLNALSKNYTTTLAYPFKVNFDRANQIEVDKIPKTIELSVSGKGWDLIRELSFSFKNPLNFTPAHIPGKYILTNLSVEKLFNTNEHYISLNKVLSDSIKVTLDNKIQKSVVLKLNENKIPLKNNFVLLKEPRVYPNQIILTGAESVLNQINDTVLLEPFTDELIAKNFTKEINVSKIFNAKTSVKNIEISLKVSELKAKSIEIPIVSKFGKKLSKDYITVNFMLPAEYNSETIVPEDFELNISENNTELFVELAKYPIEVHTPQVIDSVIKFKN